MVPYDWRTRERRGYANILRTSLIVFCLARSVLMITDGEPFTLPTFANHHGEVIYFYRKRFLHNSVMNESRRNISCCCCCDSVSGVRARDELWEPFTGLIGRAIQHENDALSKAFIKTIRYQAFIIFATRAIAQAFTKNFCNSHFFFFLPASKSSRIRCKHMRYQKRRSRRSGMCPACPVMINRPILSSSSLSDNDINASSILMFQNTSSNNKTDLW